jgi:hypothetical protein
MGIDALEVPSLPELANVPWRRPAGESSLRRSGRLWTLTTIAHVVPLVAAAVGVVVLRPVLAPVSLILLAHAWAIPELYAARGAGVVRRDRPADGRDGAERVAVGFLGDLVGHAERALHRESGLVLEAGELGVWLIGQQGAVVVRPGGRRVLCYCVRATDPALPVADRIAHLLLALRTDERGFATVANLAFSGAGWRLRRRLREPARGALDAARARARTGRGADFALTMFVRRANVSLRHEADDPHHDSPHHILEGSAGRRPPQRG